MIWKSLQLMAVLDLLISGICIYGIVLIWRNWWRLHHQRLELIFSMVGISLAVIVVFFILDLTSMYIMPNYIGMQASMAFMTSLHLNWVWLTNLTAVGVIIFGMRRYFRDELPKAIEDAEKLEDKLAETNSEFHRLSSRYQFAISGSSDGFWSWEIGSGNLWCSPRCSELLGLDASGELDAPMVFQVHPDDDPDRRDAVRACIKSGQPIDITHRLHTSPAGYRWFRLRGKVIHDRDGRATHLAGSIQDVHREREREAQVQQLAIAVENSMQGISRLDPDGRFIEVSARYAGMLGYEPHELLGQDWRMTMPESYQDQGSQIYQSMLADGRGEGNLSALRKDGSTFVKRLLLVKGTDRNGVFIGHYCFMSDVTQDTKLKKQLEFQASHDSLTHLINRREFEMRLERAISNVKRGGEHVLCYMDLDQFKVINDTLGHTAGDELLQRLGELMLSQIRSRDTLARLGGDEFALLMEYCNEDDGVRAATQLKATIENYEFQWAGSIFKVGVSMGVVLLDNQNTDKSELLKKADTACYVAKEQGRNRLHVYHEFDHELLKRRDEMSWVSRINDALAADDFQLYAQPICSTTRKGETHYEVLVRMRHNNDFVLPGVFLPAAERYNVATQLDRWVVEHTVNLLLSNRASISGAGNVNFWAINLSGHSLGNADFQTFVTTQMQRDPQLARHICFEVTETAVISKLDTAKNFIAELKVFGCRFSLDDFGKGLSSFTYLKELEVDYLKIDGSIVRDIVSDDASLVMVRSIHEISKVMGKQSVAEWVEDEDTLNLLRKTGVEFAQGYHLGKPEPMLDVLGLIQSAKDLASD